MKKIVSMFMALVMVFTMGPNMVVKAEDDGLEKAVLGIIDLVETCVDHPKLCAHGVTGAVKTVLKEEFWDKKAEPGVADFLKFIKDLNYAEFLTADAKEELAKYPSLKDLTDADNISFSQVCNVCRTAVKSVVANHSGDKNTKEEL